MTIDDRSESVSPLTDEAALENKESTRPLDANVFRLIYVSECSYITGSLALRELAEQAVRNNVLKGITGILLLIGNVFFQILEGDEFVVSNLVYVISKDRRHRHIRVLHKEHNANRAFGKWSMGCINLSEKYDLDYKAYMTLRKHISTIIEEQNGSEKACASIIKILPRYLDRKSNAAA